MDHIQVAQLPNVHVYIKHGKYCGKPIHDKMFPVVKHLSSGSKGHGITVVDGDRKFRVIVAPENITYHDGMNGEVINITANNQPKAINHTTRAVEIVESEPFETDDEIMDRIEERFNILDEMTKATMAGNVRAMIVVGPPGVGKSYGIETRLEKSNIMAVIADTPPSYTFVKGAMSPLGLYLNLYRYSGNGNVLVFDDCDSIFSDELSLNLLKAALDSGKKRTIHWNADSNVLRREGIPDRFDFKGGVIFVTNLQFDNVRSNKLKDHLAALQSRCHYLDLSMKTMRDRVLRIKQIARTGELFSNYCFKNGEDDEIIKFVEDNKNELREVSLRMTLKIADLIKISPNKWRPLAKATCMR